MTRRSFFPALPACTFSACRPRGSVRREAILGAFLISGNGDEPIPDSVVIIEEERIREAGPREAIPVPEGSRKRHAHGAFLAPAPIDLSAQRESLPVVRSIEELRERVEAGAHGVVGTLTENERIEPGLLDRMYMRSVVWAPMLSRLAESPRLLEVAQRNTRTAADAGVPLGVAAAGNGIEAIVAELELMRDAGLSPAHLIVSATRNGALALRRENVAGTILAGRRADLLLLEANPLEDIRNLRRVRRRMSAGQWIAPSPKRTS